MAKLTKNAGRVLPIFKGDYSSVIHYLPMDIVNQNDDSWVCKKECTGVEPSKSNKEYWQPFGTATHSKYNARLSQSYADGEVLNDDGTPFREGQDTDNAKYYSELSKQSALNAASEVKEELKEYSDSAKQCEENSQNYMNQTEELKKQIESSISDSAISSFFVDEFGNLCVIQGNNSEVKYTLNEFGELEVTISE